MDDLKEGLTEELTPLTKERLHALATLAAHRRSRIIVSPVFYEDARLLEPDRFIGTAPRVAVGPEVVIDYTLTGSVWRLERA